MDTIAVILAAGHGTRMKSRIPKVMHLLMGKPLVRYSVELASSVTGQKPYVVIGHGADQVKKTLGDDAAFITQVEQLGTGHAVQQAAHALNDFTGQILIISADMPLFLNKTIAELIQTQAENSGPLSLLTVTGEDSAWVWPHHSKFI